MSPAEYIELVQNARADVASFIMNFMTVLFAFLTMAYLVGKKLSYTQLVLVGVLYTLFSYYLISSVVITYDVMYELIAQFTAEHKDVATSYYSGRGKGKDQITVLLLAAWVLSMVFLGIVKFSKEDA